MSHVMTWLASVLCGTVAAWVLSGPLQAPTVIAATAGAACVAIGLAINSSR